MPVVSLQPNFKIAPWFVYPNYGRARIYVEANIPVDVIVVNPQQLKEVNSIADAQRLGLLNFPNQTLVHQIVTIPDAWKYTGWNLIIGHPGIPYALQAHTGQQTTSPPPAAAKYAAMAFRAPHEDYTLR